MAVLPNNWMQFSEGLQRPTKSLLGLLDGIQACTKANQGNAIRLCLIGSLHLPQV